ncbi:hypothetical protein DXT89_14655 [Agrobacterium vitis]|uniref:Uncharacterized protein n=1 Tax=Agrobacterium vitis TaxID=373 RepID=A0A368NUG1_AGRVI|nr:hypothetical protein DXM22_21270 [Agrobacterium vitis]KAA3526611.1 hypothetical protein DXT89_14655 [Agrobacterium vitis]RCU54192.1 hypothetical protein ASB66_014325 [Agrobacterium vitis]
MIDSAEFRAFFSPLGLIGTQEHSDSSMKAQVFAWHLMAFMRHLFEQKAARRLIYTAKPLPLSLS